MNNKATHWIKACRPKTLPLALAGIITGFALAQRKTEAGLLIFCLAALTAIFLQVLSNLANDLGDFDKGTDDEQRTDRALASGAISRKAMIRAVMFLSVASLSTGLALLLSAFSGFSSEFWWMLAIGCLAILAALNYTMGKKPYGYSGFGDLFVFLFFGITAVLGTSYLMSHTLDWKEVLPASVIGLMSVAVLNINNLRDLERDRDNAKRTLAVLLGRKQAESYQWLLYVLASALWIVYMLLERSATDVLVFIPLILMVIKWYKHPVNGMQESGAAPWNALLKSQALGTFATALLFLLSDFL